MKKNYTLTLLTLMLLTFCFSCKKNTSTTAPTTNLEYQITPMSGSFIEIKYNDKDGNPIVITDPSEFTNGTKSISASKKPFNAKLETTIINSTNKSMSYTLIIKVDGKIMKVTNANAPAMETITSFVEYTVE